MKKILSITIALCLVFASVLPVYAEAWTSNEAQQVTSAVTSILAQVLQISSKLGTIDGNGNSVLDNISLQLAHLESWLVPVGANTGTATLLDSIIVLTNYAMNHLPDISTIAGYVSSWMSINNARLADIRNAIYNYSAANMNYGSWSWANASKYAHTQLLGNDPFGVDWNGAYKVLWMNDSGVISSRNFRWDYGSPIGNVVLMEDTINNNLLQSYSDFRTKALTDYTGQLGIWDSQGETLNQEGWSPTSAINGLYKYLAYTQRDVARLTYVLASDEEIETREKARATQTAVMDDFVDPDGAGAASVDDFGSISDASSGVQSNFNTGVSAGGVWNVFERNYEWFSQETADNLAYQPQRSNRNLKAIPDQEYETPYLDSYYEELHDIIGF